MQLNVVEKFEDECSLDDSAAWSAIAQIMGSNPLELIDFFFQATFSAAQVAD